MPDMFDISKSKYCRGVQCPKMLWMDLHMPEKAEDVLSETVMANGNMVGELAREYFGSYELVPFDYQKQVMADKTAELMKAGAENIAEAAFYVDGLYCAVDILHRDGDGYDIVEVKSSTHVSDIYLEDMSFQYYVLQRCGVPVKKVCILYLNSHYVRRGPLELDKLFVLEDYTEIAQKKASVVAENIAVFRDYIRNEEEPEKDIDVCCASPYDCAYYSYCSRHLPTPSIFNIRRLPSAKKYEYYHQGIVSYQDIIEKQPPLGPKQVKQVESEFFSRADEIRPRAVKAFLKKLRYPLYHLDFETFQQAVPLYDGISPYDQIPFQYSLHIEQEDGTLEHREFLAQEGTDPRRAVAEHLCADIPTDVCVLAYNMRFERSVLQGLADFFPDLAEHLLAVRENIQDLMIPFQNQDYYSRAMQGSYSIKYVLPALCPGDPELDYHALDGVHNGGEASAAFADMPNHTPEEITVIRRNLLAYCGLDTLAMVKVLEKLRVSVKES